MRVCAAHVLVQRNLQGVSRCARDRKRCTQNGVCAQSALVVGSIDLKQSIVNATLVFGIEAIQRLGDFGVHVVNGIKRAFAQVAILVAVTQLNGLESAGRSTRWHSRATHGAVVQNDLDLNGRVAARVKNLTTIHINNDAHCILLTGLVLMTRSLL